MQRKVHLYFDLRYCISVHQNIPQKDQDFYRQLNSRPTMDGEKQMSVQNSLRKMPYMVRKTHCSLELTFYAYNDGICMSVDTLMCG